MKEYQLTRGLAMLLCVFSFLITHAQDRRISGSVKDIDGNPLGGASVAVKNSNLSTSTNEAGNFTIQVPANARALTVSYVGMQTQEVAIGNSNTVSVTLEAATNTLNDVIVIGYGAVKRRDLTGSVASVRGADLIRAAPTDVVSALQGRMAGVVVSTSDGAPGAGLNIQIRGTNSFSSGTSPLYVIDGVPYGGSNAGNTPASASGGITQTTNALGFLNPNDIESVEVLKDASATAIYGSRGANGVVLITTKKGKKGLDKVEYSGNYGISQVIKKIPVLNAHTYALLQNESYETANRIEGTTYDIPYSGEMRLDIRSGKMNKTKTPDEYIGLGTDWQDILFRNAITNNHTVSVSGGSNAGSHLLSINYLDQDGVIIGSGYKKFAVRTNLNRNIKDWLVVGTNLNFAQETNSMVKTNTTDNAHAEGVTRSALTYSPTLTLMDTLNNDFSQSELITNPYLYATTLYNRVRSNSFYTSSFLEASLYKGLKFRQNVGFTTYTARRDEYLPRTTYEGRNLDGVAAIGINDWNHIVSESIFSYLTELGKHSISATTGFIYEKSEYKFENNRATGFVNDLLQNNNMFAAKNHDKTRTGRGESALASFLGRVNYNYDNRYLLTVSYRADGSSKFAKNNKWAYFPSVAAAWSVTDEEFMRSSKTFTQLKIRAGYGKTGNQAISSYGTLDRFTPIDYVFNGTPVSGYVPDQFAGPGNDDLKWETTDQLNIGVDAELANSRIRFTADYYYKKTSDLLQRLVIPGSNGFTSKLVNSGSIENKGVELTLNVVAVNTANFSWTIGGNISFNRNKILSLGNDVTEQFAQSLDYRAQNAPFIQRVGLPIGALYSWVEEGIYRNEAEVRADPVNSGLSDANIIKKIGEIRYRDLNKDNVIGVEDRTIIGDVNPNYTYGINTNLVYKNFDLNIFINGRHGGDIINMNYRLFNDVGTYNNITQEAYDNRWTPENWEHATYPKAWYQYSRSFYITRRFLESGTFLRLRNVVLGYNLPLKSKRIFERVRVYVSGTNLVTISDYKGFDPDINGFGDNPALRGVDLAAYPNSKTVNFGVQVGF